ncbi:sodium-independent sulfate anion transporter-like [Macrosteles quadrilineatus]|uniref:sodium-independent sulfate anion transporter-like n=1 Tax=Macrosteles quadrilineatus TaxID=74068 RepID=UPI0023E229E1|nr:sodium-independent sulfate anion transporter-like [Macrosteles quadrilineatus]
MTEGGGEKVDHSTSTTPTFQRKFIQRHEQSVSVGSDDFILVEDLGPHRKISVKEKVDNIKPWVSHKIQKSMTKKNLKRRFPITCWLPGYSSEDAVGDLVAGVTVGLTVIPQSLAYSNIAGLPAQHGLYGSFLGAFMYIFLGSCKDVPMGPTAICSLLTYTTLKNLGPAYATLLCFLSGVIQLLMGIAGLGIIIDFISGPVSSGFTSAVALLILMSQVKDILGIKAAGSTFVEMAISIYKDIHNTRFWDTFLGIICIFCLLLLRLLSDVKIGPDEWTGVARTRYQRIFNKVVWMIGTSRNSILVIVGGILGFYLYQPGLPLKEQAVLLIGHIPPGLPTIEPPPFSVTKGNVTYGFVDMVTQMGQGVIVTPLIALLENIAICKAFANGKTVDATQELIAVGLCNIGNSFCHSFPGSGSLSRSAVNNSSGVRTPLGGLYTGILVIVSLMFCTPYFFFIPKTVLAAVIVAAVVFMVEVRVVKPIYRSKKSDLIPGIATFIACLVLKLEVGILIGIGLNLISILYHAARPKISMEIMKSRGGVEYLLLTPDRCLIFPSVDYVSNLVTKHSIKQGIPVVIDCSHIYGADFTAAKVIEMLTQDFSRRRQPLFFYNLKPSVVAVFEGIKPKDFVVYYNEHQLDNLLLQHTANLRKMANLRDFKA